jgi:hypothetical protein
MGMEHGWNNTLGKTVVPREKPFQFIKKKNPKRGNNVANMSYLDLNSVSLLSVVSQWTELKK